MSDSKMSDSNKVLAVGGAAAAIANRYFEWEIVNAASRQQQRIERCECPWVGVNVSVESEQIRPPTVAGPRPRSVGSRSAAEGD